MIIKYTKHHFFKIKFIRVKLLLSDNCIDGHLRRSFGSDTAGDL